MFRKKSDNRLKCSFCGKSQDSVKKLIAGPGVYICNECVELCLEILEEGEEGLVQDQINSKELILEMPFIADLNPSLSFDEELNALIDKVLMPLEQISNRYGELQEGSIFEPGIRNLLILKSIKQGRLKKELLPLLSTLGEYYKSHGELKAARNVYGWALEICDSDKECEEETRRSISIELVKLHMKTGEFNECEELLDKFVDSL